MAATGIVRNAGSSMMAPDAVVRQWKGITAARLSTHAVKNASNSVRSLMRRVIVMDDVWARLKMRGAQPSLVAAYQRRKLKTPKHSAHWQLKFNPSLFPLPFPSNPQAESPNPRDISGARSAPPRGGPAGASPLRPTPTSRPECASPHSQEEPPQ